MAETLERYIKETWARGLERHYGGEIPPLQTVIERALAEHSTYHPEDWVSTEGRQDWFTSYTEDFVSLSGDRTVDLSDFIIALQELEESGDAKAT